MIPTRTVIWAGGVTARGTIASELGEDTTRDGRVVVDSDLAVPGRSGVRRWRCRRHPASRARTRSVRNWPRWPSSRGAMPPTRSLLRRVGDPPRPFRYRDKGTMATIGRRAAIAQLRGGVVLRGTVGWPAWFGLHLVYLMGFRNRLTVLVNWTWRYLNWPSGPRIIAGYHRYSPVEASPAQTHRALTGDGIPSNGRRLPGAPDRATSPEFTPSHR